MDKTLLDVFKLGLVKDCLYRIKLSFIFLLFNIYYQTLCRNFNRNFTKRLKFRKRFCGGASLGYTISNFIQKDEKNSSFIKDYKNGIIYGYWGISIIILDYIQDNLINDKNKVRELYNQCLHILVSGFDTSYKKQWSSESNSNKAIIYTAQDLFSKLHFLISNLGISIQKFYSDTATLLDGQYNSMEQKSFGAEKDFNWYYTSILNQKTVNFYLAPISLFSYSEMAYQNFKRLEDAFYKLNLCYFHWQGIDDVADLKKDTNDSIISMPGYILISQGKISEKFLNIQRGSNQNEKMLACLEESKLIIEPFSTIKLFENEDYDQNNEIVYKLRLAICNSESDLKRDLNDLAKEKVSIKDDFIRAYLEKDYCKILNCLKLSKACERVILATQNVIFINQFEKALLNESLKLKVTMKSLNYIISNCYSKAIKFVSSN